MTPAPTFNDLYKQHSPHLANYLRHFCDHLAEAEDVLQETFLLAWKHLPNPEIRDVRSWLIGVARRIYWGMRRGLLARTPGRSVEYNPFQDERQAPDNPELAAYVAQLRDHFAGLGPAQSAVMTGLADGKTLKEIADERGTSQQAASLSASLARKQLGKLGIA